MRHLSSTAILVIAVGLAINVRAADPPGWAYGFPPAGSPAAPLPRRHRHRTQA